MRVTLLRELPDDPILRSQWNRLAFAMDSPEIFYTYEWAMAVQRAYSNLLTPLYMLAYEGSSLVAVVALATGSNQQKATFLCSSTGDYCEFLSDPELRMPFVEAVFAELRKLGIRTVSLTNLPAESVTVKAINSGGSNHGYYVWLRPAYACARVLLGSQQQRKEIKKNLQRKKVLHRSLNGLAKCGSVELTHLRTWDDFQAELPHFSNAHVGRFLSTGRISNLVRPERRRFLEELARLLSSTGWLAISRLAVGKSTVAWNYGFQFAGSWFWYQPVLNSRFNRYSPGFCLLSKMIVEACDRPDLKLIDLGLGEEAYKERVTSDTRQTLHLTLTQSRTTQIKEALRYCSAQLVKSSPFVERHVRLWLRKLAVCCELSGKSGTSGLAAWVFRRTWQKIFGCDEVFFCEFPATTRQRSSPSSFSFFIKPIDLELLATAAIEHADDSNTLAYLLRGASRLGETQQRGFALVGDSGIPVHFVWIAPLAGFHVAELNLKLPSDDPKSVLLFDCLTPDSVRGRGFYAIAIHMLAAKLLAEGWSPWIFSAATNLSSVRGIEKAGFLRRYSLSRRKLLLWQKITTREVSEIPLAPMEVSATA